MTVALRLIDTPENYWDAETGDIWPCWNANGSHDVEGRGPCYVIKLPGNGGAFHTNMKATDAGYWEVTGEAPNITVKPSINVGPEVWHGWITDGGLSPDVDKYGHA